MFPKNQGDIFARSPSIIVLKGHLSRLFVNVLLGGEKPWLLLANRKSIRQVSLNGKHYNDVFSNLSRTVAIDFDVGEKKLYWTDVTDNAIYGTNVFFDQDGSHPGEVG